MVIRGFTGRVRALFKTEVNLGDNFRLNNFANQTLWYAQYFWGRETLTVQNGKCYFVEKRATDHSSWMPAAVKTGAYFGLAVLFIIPGTIARLMSLDSPQVRRVIFANRVSLVPPVVAKKVKSPKPPLPALVMPAAASPPKDTPKPIAPTLPPTEAAAPPALTAAPAAIAAKKDEPIIPREFELSEKVDIAYEIDETLSFFEALPKQKAKNIQRWVEERKKFGLSSPFEFAHHLLLCIKQDRQKLHFIPQATLDKWQAAYAAGCQKLKDLNLTTYLEVWCSPASLGKQNGHIQNAIDFYKTFLDPTNGAAWLDERAQAVTYQYPFFFTLIWLAWNEVREGLDPIKVRTIEAFYVRAKTKLHQIGATRYLKETVPSLSPGTCALVHLFSLERTAPLLNVRPAAAGTPPKMGDAQLKEILLQSSPGMSVLIKNDRLFQKYKDQMIARTIIAWEGHVELLREFLNLESKKDMVQWISQQTEIPAPVPIFSAKFLPILEKTQPILDEKLAQTCRNLHSQLRTIVEERNITIKTKTIHDTPGQVTHMKRVLNASIGQANDLFEKILQETDGIIIGVLLKKAKNHPTYTYPFYYTKELQDNLELLTLCVTPAVFIKWKKLAPGALQKLEDLKLTEFLDEVPPETLLILGLFTADTILGKTG
jgi:hypothetical protein